MRLKAWRASVTVAACTWSNFIKHQEEEETSLVFWRRWGGMRGKEARGSGTL